MHQPPILSDPFFGEARSLAPALRRARWYALGLGACVALVVLLGTPGELRPGADALHGTVTLGMGVGPQPGAPLTYLLLAAANSILGFLPSPVALHLATALMVAGGTMLLFGFLCETLGGHARAAAMAAAATAFHPAVWSSAVQAAPAALAWPLVTGIAWMLWRFGAGRDAAEAMEGDDDEHAVAAPLSARSLLLAGAAGGCLMAASPAFAVVIPPLVMIPVWHWRWLARRPAVWIGTLLVGCLCGVTLFTPALRNEASVALSAAYIPESWRHVPRYIGLWDGWYAMADTARGQGAPLTIVSEELALVGFGWLGLGVAVALLGVRGCGGNGGCREMRLRIVPSWCVALAFAVALYVGGLKALAWITVAAALPAAWLGGRHAWPVMWLAIAAGWCVLLLPPEPVQPQLAQFPVLIAGAVLMAFGLARLEAGLPRVGRFLGLALPLAQWVVFGAGVPYLAGSAPLGSVELHAPPAGAGRAIDRLGSAAYRCAHWDIAFTQLEMQELERSVWPVTSREVLAVVDSDLHPLFVLHQLLRGRFLGFWFIENTGEGRYLRHPANDRAIYARNASALIRSHFPQWEVIAITRSRMPPQPPVGARFIAMASFEVAGHRVTLWRLTWSMV